MQLDLDIQKEGMCSDCLIDIETKKCTRCGKDMKQTDGAVNKGFDVMVKKHEQLANELEAKKIEGGSYG